MSIRENSGTDFRPRVAHILSQLDPKWLYHDAHELKHPLAMYNVSIHKTEEAFNGFFKIHRSLVPEHALGSTLTSNDLIKESLVSYRAVLYSLREHLDDCYHIAKSLLPPLNNDADDERNQYEWLRRQGRGTAAAVFLQRVSPYKWLLDNIVNELKHRNGVLSGVAFHDPQWGILIPGYYVANVLRGHYNPVPSIHPTWKGQRTGFSFARDVRLHLVWIHEISAALCDLISSLHGNRVTPRGAISPNETTRALYAYVREMSNRCFPDEVTKPFPEIAEGPGSVLVFRSRSSIQPRPFASGCSVHLLWTGDGVTRDFGLLYYTGQPAAVRRRSPTVRN